MGTRKIRQGLLAVVMAGGVLLTGCSSGAGQNTDRAVDGSGKERRGTAPMPAPPAPDGRREGSQQDGKERDFAPPADYLSTFALDVDTASYGFARRTLAEGRLPDPATVRPEEFVNSFRQDYPRPEGDGFSVNVDGARTDEDGWSLMRVGLATRADGSDGERPPAALTFVIDVSGSMAEPGRLDLVKESLGIMTDKLRDDDSIALVTFSDSAETVLPMTRLGDHRGTVHSAIDAMEPTQSTNLEAGIRTGYDTAVSSRRDGSTNRVVLLSDALANTGETSADGILERISDARREHGITLFGVGVGSDYGDALMERLADKGDGHTTYVSDSEEARKVFCEQLPANIELRARDAKAQVAFDPQTVKQFRLIGYENREVADDDFRDDSVDGGEVGPGHTVTALYAVRMRPGASGHVATAGVRWLDPDSRDPHEESNEIESGDLDGGLWDAGRGLRTAAVAAYFADALRQGTYAQSEPGDPAVRPGTGTTGNAPDPMSTSTTSSGSTGWQPLPGAPSLADLARSAEELSSGDDTSLRDLATAVRQADRLTGGYGDGGGGGEDEGEIRTG
ncbi:VWA domain-containing protein [Streptomyces durmitorensis]|uniref:VWA domain-containing protein n=1 Tax=Streptomyces durmitorensis TaxID=319947 RepID=A0ABY4PZT0_9ACTN|nr:VWA domain-containing protein [Streptomyces durmitorensis]UQT58467.1 VWA domain-containing protein [Streptomyces durmitorensis]